MDGQASVDVVFARPPWEGEERLVRGAIMMVATSGSPRVMVAGIAFGDQIVDRCKRAALEAGVRVISKRAVGTDRLDLVVEAIR
jgi:hypothetical protein